MSCRVRGTWYIFHNRGTIFTRHQEKGCCMFTILSTASMLGIMASTYYFKNKASDNDHEKIKTIADNIGLYVTENKQKQSIRIYRKIQKENYSEYIYKIPLGLSFKQFEEKKQLFIDGLNNKSKHDFSLANLKTINWKGDILEQLKRLLNNRIKLDKQVEMEYDGMLKFRVYDEGLKTLYNLTEEIMGSCKDWNIPLGVMQDKQILHDFETGPHMLVGGTTDMGKSTILNVIINTLLYNRPEDVEFTLIDLKGGLEFGLYENLKQVKHFASDIDGAEEVLEEAKNDMSNIFDMLRRTGKKNVKQAGIKERHFVIVDEAAELTSAGELDKETKKKKINCENYIKDISRRGRASGMRLIYSTQYPTTETISSQVKRNLITRICLPVDTSTASTVVLDEGGAEKLPLIQGRAIYKRHRTKTMQSYYIDDGLINNNIKPHINIQSKEGLDASCKVKKHEQTRGNTFKFETVGLHDQKANSKNP